MVYIYDCIIIYKDDANIDSLIRSLHDGDTIFYFTDDGPVKNYLGVEFTKRPDGFKEMKQDF